MAHKICPDCESPKTKKHGFRSGVQRYLCKDCRKPFMTEEPAKPLGDMRLPLDKARLIVHLLVEGNGVSATARIADVHKKTVLNLLVLMGEKCQRILDEKVQNVTANHIQADEIWTFVRKKQKRVKFDDPKSWGDAYCFISLDAETTLVINHRVGKRTGQTTLHFIRDLFERLAEGCKPQLTTDGFTPYIDAVEDAFGADVDFAQLVKLFQGDVEPGRERYSPGGLLAIVKSVVTGRPDEDLISTSYVERQNF